PSRRGTPARACPPGSSSTSCFRRCWPGGLSWWTSEKSSACPSAADHYRPHSAMLLQKMVWCWVPGGRHLWLGWLARHDCCQWPGCPSCVVEASGASSWGENPAFCTVNQPAGLSIDRLYHSGGVGDCERGGGGVGKGSLGWNNIS